MKDVKRRRQQEAPSSLFGDVKGDDVPIRQHEPHEVLQSCVTELSGQSGELITLTFLSSGQKVSRELRWYKIDTLNFTKSGLSQPFTATAADF